MTTAWPDRPEIERNARVWRHDNGDMIINPIGYGRFGAVSAAVEFGPFRSMSLGVFSTWQQAADALQRYRESDHDRVPGS